MQAFDHPPVQPWPDGVRLARAQGGQNGPPQVRLPALLGRQFQAASVGADQHLLPPRPGLQPVDPIVLILIEQVGQLARELQATPRVVIAQVTPDRPEIVQRQQVGEDLHQAPGHGHLVERRLPGYGPWPQHLAIGPPQEAPRQLHPHGRADSPEAGQFHLEPLGHAVALDQDHLLLQRPQWMTGEPALHR